MIRTMLALVLAVLTTLTAAQVSVQQSEGLDVTLQSQQQPVPLNQMHSWVITLRTPAGMPMEGATILVEGGMPEHDHGLATSPEVTTYLGEGRYLLEGVRFHMTGEWQLLLQIEHQGRQYSATVALSL